MKTLYRMSIIASAGIVLFASCSNVKDSTEYQELSSQVAELQNQASSARLELKDNLRKLEMATNNSKVADKKLATLKIERQNKRTDISQILMNDVVRAKAIQKYAIPACRAVEKNYGLFGLTEDDDEVKLDLVEKKIGVSQIGWWYYSIDEDSDLPGTAKLASDYKSVRKSCAREGSDEFFKTCKTFDKRFMKKDPSTFKGQCVRGRVKVVQFDTNTGKCAFQGYLDGDYGFRAQFGVVLDAEDHQSQTDCEWTSEIVEDMYINFWAAGLDAYTYDTSNGGRQTVPAFRILQWQ